MPHGIFLPADGCPACKHTKSSAEDHRHQWIDENENIRTCWQIGQVLINNYITVRQYLRDEYNLDEKGVTEFLTNLHKVFTWKILPSD